MSRLRSPWLIVAAVALLNGILYCCALPLWEGFDEPFHYGYVQSLSTAHSVPVMGQARISEEIHDSFLAVPLSRLLSATIPGALSFEQWSKVSQADKRRRESALVFVNASMQRQPSTVLNYEAQQTPLFYAVCAPIDAILSGVPIRVRILTLRLVFTITGLALLCIAVVSVARELNLQPCFTLGALLCTFTLQMIYASLAHVGNDALSVPLSALFLAWLFAAARRPTAKTAVILALILTAGLLTKAYFLAFAPVFAAYVLSAFFVKHALSRRTLLLAFGLIIAGAGPWYGRNLLLFRSLSGTQQSVSGVGVMQSAQALAAIPWPEAILHFARWSIWTGNWSFLSFSQTTVYLEISLLLAGFVLYLVCRKALSQPELWLLAAIASFGLSLLYQTGATFIHTGGNSMHPEPWYAQGVLVCLIVLVFRGFETSGLLGRVLATVLCAVGVWIALATYFAKLLPYYGAAINRGNVAAVWAWWTRTPAADIESVALVPPAALFALLGFFAATTLAAGCLVTRGIWSRRALARDIHECRTVPAENGGGVRFRELLRLR